MLIGTMNHPERPVIDEIAWMADAGMEFLDLTFEPPATASWEIETKAIRNALEEAHMGVVGHTAWYLPMASSIPEIRLAAVAELKRCVQKFAEVGAKWMNIHPDRHTPWHPVMFHIIARCYQHNAYQGCKDQGHQYTFSYVHKQYYQPYTK